jgi:hypothetical protein
MRVLVVVERADADLDRPWAGGAPTPAELELEGLEPISSKWERMRTTDSAARASSSSTVSSKAKRGLAQPFLNLRCCQNSS